mgnify:CR=1 FL=1
MKQSEAYAVVTRSYLVALGRIPENEGVDYWARRMLEDPTFTELELIREFAQGPESYRISSESWGVNAYYKARGGMPPGGPLFLRKCLQCRYIYRFCIYIVDTAIKINGCRR